MESARRAAASAVRTVGETPATARRHMPPPERMLYYAGLGALAALEVVSWPVAIALGAGVWVATRKRATNA
jgi:hypothetical protein